MHPSARRSPTGRDLLAIKPPKEETRFLLPPDLRTSHVVAHQMLSEGIETVKFPKLGEIVGMPTTTFRTGP
jgi:hypothetical protein